jgi:hypothetical protein
MESLTSREAAERLGVSVRQWHGLVAKHKLRPVRELPGLRGAKFWSVDDVDSVRPEVAA